MKTSLILTVHDRPAEVSKAVSGSFRLPGNQPDEVIIVLDRATDAARDGALAAWEGYPAPVLFVPITGDPGWLCPAKAWNVGFKAATGDLFYCISSEVVQDIENIANAKSTLVAYGKPAAIFGACHNSKAEVLVNGADPGLLISSALPRPLGFIVAMPAANVRQVGGFDENFMAGFWFDDDDFFYRMWQTGLDFIFDDVVHGTHLHHERASLTQAGIQTNAAYMVKKHGTPHLWHTLIRMNTMNNGQTIWSHI